MNDVSMIFKFYIQFSFHFNTKMIGTEVIAIYTFATDVEFHLIHRSFTTKSVQTTVKTQMKKFVVMYSTIILFP